jgi:PhnB protein
VAINTYLNFKGNTREAVEFYASVFGVEVPEIMTFGQAPQNPDHPLPEGMENGVMHARLDVAGGTLMFSDTFPNMPLTFGDNISLVLNLSNQDEVATYYNRLKDGGNVQMELQETFWSKSYGIVKDKFGITWQVSLEA